MTLFSKRKYGQILTSKPTLENLEPRHLLAADVYISEFVASNELLLDEDADDPDWLELFNAGPDDVNLASWYLTDDDGQLDKWGFPETVLAAGDSLLVFASGKDRAVAGQPLHTNFKLSAGGEYLGLTRDSEDGNTLVVSAFSPDFPQQTTNVAFGFPQQVDVTEFVTSNSESKLLIPTSEPDASWMSSDFDDAAWTTATAAVGYQQTVPGFTIEHARDIAFGFENLQEATDLLDGVGRYAGEETSLRVATDVYPIIDFYDAEGGGSRGRFRHAQAPFPGNNSIETLLTEEELAEILEQGTDLETLRDDNIFAIRASGTITIPETGTWTFHTNSDDGVQVWIDGESIIREDTLHFQGPTDTLAVVELEAGPHSVDLVYFEYVIGATLELSAAPGELTRFNRNEFTLVGDVENGGLPVRTSSSGGDARLPGFVTTDLTESMTNQASSAYLRIPFEIDDPNELETLSLQMRYDDGFVAFLNGHEIARRNAPESTAFDSTSTEPR